MPDPEKLSVNHHYRLPTRPGELNCIHGQAASDQQHHWRVQSSRRLRPADHPLDGEGQRRPKQ